MKKSVVFLFIAILTATLSGCILSKSPSTNSVTMTLGEQKTFSVNVFPSGGTFTWTLDDVPLTNNGKSYVYTAEAGDHILTVKEMDSLGSSTWTWNIQVNSPPVAWKVISAGSNHSVAIKTDGSLWAWGSNMCGQLGDGTTEDKHLPKHIGIDTNWAIVSAGYWLTAAIKTDGSLWGWGYNYEGELGDGTNADKNIPTPVYEP